MADRLLLIPVVILGGTALFLVFLHLFQYLWNITMPEVFGLKQITYWQGFRLLLLSAMMFGGCWVHANR
jgi:uncharacterized membrane protein